MHYRNGREAKNGDQIVELNGGKVASVGELYAAKPGADGGQTDSYCNGYIKTVGTGPHPCACLCDCLHVDDLAAILAEKGLDKRPAGM